MVARADLEVTLKAIDRASPTVKQLESSIIRFVGAVSASIAALAAITFPIVQATKFDRALRDVQKTTGFADTEIRQLGKDILQLSTTLDTSAVSLAGIAAAAGQLGLGTQGTAAILAFSESVARAATTLDLSTDAAARASAKLVNIFQLDIGQVENLFSTINALSNTTTANAGELIDTMARIGATANLTAQQVGALSATSVDLGVSAEVAGTSLLKVFSRIQSNAQGFADAIGVSLSEFTSLPALDRFRAFLTFLSSQTDEVQAKLITTLAGGGRIFGLVNKLLGDASNNFAILDKNLATAEESFLSGQSAIEEYANISKALQIQLNILRNNFSALTTAVGQAFIPRLLELTEELTNFLQTPQAAQFFRQVGEAAQGFFEIIVKMVRAVGTLDIQFQNLLAVLKAIIALQFARILGGIASRLVLTVTSLTGLASAAAFANGPLAVTLGLFGRSRAAGATFATAIRLVTASITAGIVPALTLAIESFVAFFPIVAIGALAAIAAFIIFEDTITSAFGKVAEFFGFVTDEQAAAGKKSQAALQANITALEESTAKILTAEKELAQSGNQLPDESFAELIEKDVLLLNEALLIAQERIRILGSLAEEAARKAEALRATSASFTEDIGEQIKEVTRLAIEQAKVLIELEQARIRAAEAEGAADEFDPGATADPGAARDVLGLEERLAEIDAERAAAQEFIEAKQREVVRAKQEALELDEKATQAAQEQLKIFENTVGLLSNDLQRAFKLEVDARQAEVELADLEVTLANLQTQIEEQPLVAAGGGTQAQQAEFFRLRDAAEAAQKAIDDFGPTAENARKAADDFAESSLNLGEALVFDRGLQSLAVTAKGLEAVESFLGQLPPAAKETGEALEEAFIKGAVAAVKQQDALQDLLVAQEETKKELAAIAKAAESVFNNTATEVRAFARSVLTSVEEFRINLARRPLELAFKVRQEEIREALSTIETERERLTKRLEELEEEDANSRLSASIVFEKNKTKAALAELETRGRALEDLERANNRRRLENEFAAIQERTNELLARARQAAEQGNLSEALGLKELAKTQIPDLFKTLGQLGDLTTGEGRPLVSTESLEALLDQVQDLSGQVQTEIPGINQALKDSTEKALTDITAAVSQTTESLKTVTAQLGQMSAAITGFAQAIPAILRAIPAIEAAGGGIARGAGTPGAGDTSQAARNAVTGSVDAANAQTTAAEQAKAAQDRNTAALKEASDAFKAAAAARSEEETRRQQGILGGATGGQIRGRGTGTSDSILARVSNGEFIMNAATTRFFGSKFFHGLQNFAKGGFSVPAFAGGGSVGNSVLTQAGGPPGSPVNITLPSGEQLRLATGVSTVEDIKRVFSREARKAGRRLR